MKDKAVITYVKDGIEVTKEINFFNRKKIMKTIFDHPFWQFEDYDKYYINEGVEFIYFKNITFYRDVKFYSEKNTSLIFENCVFNGGRLWFIGGTVEVIKPDMNPAYFVNRIDVINTDDFSISLKEGEQNQLYVAAATKGFFFDGQMGSSILAVEGDNIILKDVSSLKRLSLKGKVVKFNNCNLDFNVDVSSNIVVKGESVALINSNLCSNKDLCINSSRILLDDNSSLKSMGDITLGNDTFKNVSEKSVLVLTKDKILGQTDNIRILRNLISDLKGIKQICEEEIKNNKKVKENLLKEQYQAEKDFYNRNILKDRVRVRVKKYESGLRKYKKVSEYFKDR